MLCCFACSAIAFNFIDYHFDFTSQTYGIMLSFINIMELAMLVLYGVRMHKNGDSRNYINGFKRWASFFAGGCCNPYRVFNIQEIEKEEER